MTGQDNAIVTLYEDCQMTPEQIAQSEGYQIMAVKACLMAHSSVYKEALKLKEEDGFTEQDQKDAVRAIAELMRNSTDEHVIKDCAKFIRNDYKGRLDVKPKEVKNLNVSITNWNMLINRANEVREKAKQRVIELQPTS